MDDKIIVTNRSALVKKYGTKSLAAIRKALTSLITADKARGIKSRVIYLDNAVNMKSVGGKAVMNATDPRENKLAVDAIFKSLNPAYLMLLGAPDVVPHQDLNNTAFSPPDDDDARAWGDLPYACDAPYSTDPAKFIGPNRVVGRLPDLTGASEPSYLLTILKTAGAYQTRSPDAYASYFGLSAAVWEGSTRLSLHNIFGNATGLLLAPPSGPNYGAGQLGARSHFINCHGGPASPEFAGQKGKTYPTSLTTQATVSQIVDGTVASVECCYGAELYDSVTLAIDPPICQSYLRQGAYGYFGSTTIAYGPADDNGAADFICQYFLLEILNGASIGRAALVARQKFVANTAQMDPIDLKTLAQFCLLGDPSVHPVVQPGAAGLPKGVAKADAERFFRAERRAKLRLVGDFLAETKPTASKQVATGKLSPKTKTALSNIAKLAGLTLNREFTAFAVKGAPSLMSSGAKTATAPSRYYLMIGTPKGDTAEKVKHGVAAVAKELDGRIVSYRIYEQR